MSFCAISGAHRYQQKSLICRYIEATHCSVSVNECRQMSPLLLPLLCCHVRFLQRLARSLILTCETVKMRPYSSDPRLRVVAAVDRRIARGGCRDFWRVPNNYQGLPSPAPRHSTPRYCFQVIKHPGLRFRAPLNEEAPEVELALV